jgi:hypothetical protein
MEMEVDPQVRQVRNRIVRSVSSVGFPVNEIVVRNALLVAVQIKEEQDK